MAEQSKKEQIYNEVGKDSSAAMGSVMFFALANPLLQKLNSGLKFTQSQMARLETNIVSYFQNNMLMVANGGFRANIGMAGWFGDGNGQYQFRPIICSTSRLFGADADDIWVVNAGYKILTYDAFNYVGYLGGYDNTYGTKAEVFPSGSTNANRTASFRVYYNNVEIILSNIS